MGNVFKFLSIFVAFAVAVIAAIAAFQGGCSHFGTALVGEGQPQPPNMACTCLGFELYTIDEALHGGPSDSICIGVITGRSYRDTPAQETSPAQ